MKDINKNKSSESVEDKKIHEKVKFKSFSKVTLAETTKKKQGKS